MRGEDRDCVSTDDLPSGDQRSTRTTVETGESVYGSIVLELFDEDSEISLTAYQYDDGETNDVEISVAIGSADVTVGCSPARARQFAQELTTAADAAGEATPEK